jgi:hypothetical protein
MNAVSGTHFLKEVIVRRVKAEADEWQETKNEVLFLHGNHDDLVFCELTEYMETKNLISRLDVSNLINPRNLGVFQVHPRINVHQVVYLSCDKRECAK